MSPLIPFLLVMLTIATHLCVMFIPWVVSHGCHAGVFWLDGIDNKTGVCLLTDPRVDGCQHTEVNVIISCSNICMIPAVILILFRPAKKYYALVCILVIAISCSIHLQECISRWKSRYHGSYTPVGRVPFIPIIFGAISARLVYNDVRVHSETHPTGLPV